MGLSSASTGKNAVDKTLVPKKENPTDKIIALAGNPNVGKSTVFNELTGLKQHTGNWAGKTVTNAVGYFSHHDTNYIVVDLPGTYSLFAHSAEEEVSRDFLCFGGADAVIVVCDALCLERNLNLVLQTLEITSEVIVCVNLMDEAEKKGISVDFQKLEQILGVPVVGTSARKKEGLDILVNTLEKKLSSCECKSPRKTIYPHHVETAVSMLEPTIAQTLPQKLNTRWAALRLLDADNSLQQSLNQYLGFDVQKNDVLMNSLHCAQSYLELNNINHGMLKDKIVSTIILDAEKIARVCVCNKEKAYSDKDRKIDKILIGRLTGFPIMIALLALVLWITIIGANYPSAVLSNLLFRFEGTLLQILSFIHIPSSIANPLVYGVYRVMAWVIAVMLPPMAIFFPLFTILEDLGYLPRVAFNLDGAFKKCCACGKQALTMCQGFGCNAAGVTGCRIIDSPRERLIAIITNCFVPCNGRFPTLIAVITMFFTASVPLASKSIISTLMLTCVILFGIFMTFFVSKILSKTLLKGFPSSFTLELPPLRPPQIKSIIVRSLFDRTLFVLGRAIIAAAPAGLIIWLMANVMVGEYSVLHHFSTFLDPFGHIMGLDGVILMAFILGFPANEIVIPIIMMAYMASGTLAEYTSLSQLHSLLVDNGWTWATAMSMMLFCLMHWPCSTTCLTIKKETASLKWTLVSIAVPTGAGFLCCFLFTTIVRLFHLV